MASLYIRWVKGLSKRREVMLISRLLNMSRREAACCCMEVWEWADDETEDGHISGATLADVDAVILVPGFARAMTEQNVGWLHETKDGITFPRWDKNNGESAKKRDRERLKKQQQRNLGKSKKSPKRPRNVPSENGDQKGTPLSLSLSLSLLDSSKKKELENALETWVQYKIDRKEKYLDRGLAAMVTHATNIADEHGAQTVIDAIRRAMANGWKGWDHDIGKSSAKQAPQRPRAIRGISDDPF